MARSSFWVMWWAVLFYLLLVGALATLFLSFVVETRAIPITVAYFVVGLLMYVCDPRYWVYGFYYDTKNNQLFMLLAWPAYYPYYLGMLFWIAYARRTKR